MPKFGMVIDLQRCVGCAACALACKAENNTGNRADGQSHNWSDYLLNTEGGFPNVVHTAIPVMCNHCSNAPCVENCPVAAMFKTAEGITMHDPALCIGCQACQGSCPYSNLELDAASLRGEAYSVISFNPKEGDPQPYWSDKSEMIPGCTASGAETAKRAGTALPAMNQFVAGDAQPLRKSGVVEKCTLCYHRTSNGQQPACVEACPSQGRIFGDQDDPNSAIAKVLKAQKSMRLQEDKGTQPNVYYVGKYSART